MSLKKVPGPSHRRKNSPRGKILWAFLLLFVAAGILHHAWTQRQYTLREEELLPLLRETADSYQLSPALVRALIWKESHFRPNAVGSKGEIGLMQITDGAVTDWARVHKCDSPTRKRLFQPSTNLEIGCWYLSQAQKHWEGYASQDILQLAEYNAGRAQVLRNWAPKEPTQPIDVTDISFDSTQDYIRKILDRKKHYELHP